MRTLGGFCFTLVLACGLSAQSRGSVTPTVTGSSGSVVFPGGTPATSPGVTRSFGGVVNPGGGGQHLTVPGGVVPSFARPAGQTRRHTAPVIAYPYPVYYGNYGGYSDAYNGEQGAPQQQPQQPNVTVVMPPPQPVTPIIINVGPGGGQYTTSTERQQGVYGPLASGPPAYEPNSQSAVPEAEPTDEAQHYLIAFKDHTIYSAIAYWVDGDTLHYFTAGNTHNQVSVSLVDRALTQRLNKESGVAFKLPVK